MQKNGGKSAIKTTMKKMLPALALFAFLGCQAPIPETDLFKENIFDRPKSMDISDCPEKVRKIIYREFSQYVVENKLQCEKAIYRIDTDQNEKDEFICFFNCPLGNTYYLILEGEQGRIVAKNGWLEMNKPLLRIVSLIKKGEFEILIKHPGGGAGFESTYLTLHKKQGSVLREVFTGDYFWHEWSVDAREKFEAKYYSAAGNELPLDIRQYEGELNQGYEKIPKNPPDYVTKKTGGRPLKIFAWDPAKFKFVERKQTR